MIVRGGCPVSNFSHKACNRIAPHLCKERKGWATSLPTVRQKHENGWATHGATSYPVRVCRFRERSFILSVRNFTD